MPDLSVVIVSYNTRELLRNCLLSLRASRGLALEVIVVDNASADDSADMVRAAFPEARLLAQALNSWYCGGNNIGIRRASADYVLLLNPDTEVAPDALALLYHFLSENPSYYGVTAQLRYPDGAIQRTCSRITDYRSLLWSFTVLGALLPGRKRAAQDRQFYGGWDRRSDRDVAVIPGSCALLRRAGLQLDEDFLLYFPEDSLAGRLGGRARFLAAAQIVHHEKSSTRNWFATNIFFRDMLVFCRKQYGWPRMLLLWLLSRPVYWLMRLKRA